MCSERFITQTGLHAVSRCICTAPLHCIAYVSDSRRPKHAMNHLPLRCLACQTIDTIDYGTSPACGCTPKAFGSLSARSSRSAGPDHPFGPLIVPFLGRRPRSISKVADREHMFFVASLSTSWTTYRGAPPTVFVYMSLDLGSGFRVLKNQLSSSIPSALAVSEDTCSSSRILFQREAWVCRGGMGATRRAS